MQLRTPSLMEVAERFPSAQSLLIFSVWELKYWVFVARNVPNRSAGLYRLDRFLRYTDFLGHLDILHHKLFFRFRHAALVSHHLKPFIDR